jgi:hypothetical protein
MLPVENYRLSRLINQERVQTAQADRQASRHAQRALGLKMRGFSPTLAIWWAWLSAWADEHLRRGADQRADAPGS